MYPVRKQGNTLPYPLDEKPFVYVGDSYVDGADRAIEARERDERIFQSEGLMNSNVIIAERNLHGLATVSISHVVPSRIQQSYAKRSYKTLSGTYGILRLHQDSTETKSPRGSAKQICSVSARMVDEEKCLWGLR